MNYLRYDPSAVLDAMVSEEIFGIKWRMVNWVRINGRDIDELTWLSGKDTPGDPRPGSYAGQTPPKYSTNMSMVMAVVYRFVEKHIPVYIEINSGIFVMFGDELRNATMVREELGLPYAISIAALVAKDLLKDEP